MADPQRKIVTGCIYHSLLNQAPSKFLRCRFVGGCRAPKDHESTVRHKCGDTGFHANVSLLFCRLLLVRDIKPEVAWARYGSVPTRSGYHHEMSLRILLQAISAAAGRHRRSIQPVLSVAIDHYVRVFVRVSRSPKAALAAGQESTSYVLQSESCPSFFLLPILPPKKQSPTRRSKPDVRGRPENINSAKTALPVASQHNPSERNSEGAISATTPGATAQSSLLGLGGTCPETGGALKAGGPIWSGPLHDKKWVTRAVAIASASGEGGDGNTDERAHGAQEAGALAPRPLLATGARVESLLRSVAGELADVPLFYNLRDMFATLGFKSHPRREQVGELNCVSCGFACGQ